METENQPKITVSISKEQLALLPMASFLGKVEVIDRPELAEAAVESLWESDVIGFDTETRPSFRKGVVNKVALMQLSTRKCCYLFRLNKIGMPEGLKRLLEDPDKLKIGLSIHDDFHNIRNLCGEFEPAGFIDLQPFVKKYSIADNSLARIYGILFGQRISKGQRLTNWEAEELTPNQQNYAALDAIACIQIYDWVTQGRFIPELSPYMQPEQEEPAAEKEGSADPTTTDNQQPTENKVEAPKTKEEVAAARRRRKRQARKRRAAEAKAAASNHSEQAT